MTCVKATGDEKILFGTSQQLVPSGMVAASESLVLRAQMIFAQTDLRLDIMKKEQVERLY